MEQYSLKDGQIAVVTGGSSGIGKAVCCALAAEGISLVVVGRDQARLDRALTEIRASRTPSHASIVIGMSLDVGKEQDMAAMVGQTMARFGRIDILVTCAGILRPPHSRPQSLEKTPLPDFQAVLRTNLTGIFLSNRAVLKPMVQQRFGVIINVASLSGRKALPLDAPYCASKFAVIGLTEALAEEVSPYGIHVHALLPGNTDTPIWGQNQILPKAVRVIPVERVAKTVVFLIRNSKGSCIPEISIAPQQPLRNIP